MDFIFPFVFDSVSYEKLIKDKVNTVSRYSMLVINTRCIRKQVIEKKITDLTINDAHWRWKPKTTIRVNVKG